MVNAFIQEDAMAFCLQINDGGEVLINAEVVGKISGVKDGFKTLTLYGEELKIPENVTSSSLLGHILFKYDVRALESQKLIS